MTGQFVLREWEDGDWAAFEPLIREVAREGTTYALDPEMDDADARAFWDDATHRVVAVDGTTLLGSAKMGPNRPAQGAHVGTASFVVAEHARGRGVGRALGEYVVAWHRREGFRAIQFNAVVSTNHAAVALWGSLGFEVVGTVPAAFRLPDGWADLLVMHLDLTRSAAPVAPASGGAAAGIDTREAVVDAAVRLFPRYGWSGTTTERLAAETGLPVADVARSFESMADLLIMTFRRVGVPGYPDLPEAFAALELERVDDVDERLERLAGFLLGLISGVAPLVPVLWHALDEDPAAAALRQGAELRRMALSRTIVELLRRGNSVSPDAIGAVQTLTTAENYLCLTGLGWSGERYAAWLADALDHAVNG